MRVGERILALQQALGDRVLALEQALTQVNHLEGLLPICAWCHKIRDDGCLTTGRAWSATSPSGPTARFTHTICPDCRTTVMPVPAAAAR